MSFRMVNSLAQAGTHLRDGTYLDWHPSRRCIERGRGRAMAEKSENAYETLYGGHDADSHDLKETTTSIVTALGNQIIRPATSFLVAFPLYFAYQHRLFEIPTTLITLVVLFVLVDFAEYWFHRAAHRVRFMPCAKVATPEP